MLAGDLMSVERGHCLGIALALDLILGRLRLRRRIVAIVLGIGRRTKGVREHRGGTAYPPCCIGRGCVWCLANQQSGISKQFPAKFHPRKVLCVSDDAKHNRNRRRVE